MSDVITNYIRYLIFEKNLVGVLPAGRLAQPWPIYIHTDDVDKQNIHCALFKTKGFFFRY